MAVTLRQLMNRVLRVLDPTDQIGSSESSITDSYHLLILSFLNTIKEEVEDAHNWRALRTNHSVSVTANTLNTAITGANERSRTVRHFSAATGCAEPLVFDVTDTPDVDPLHDMDLTHLIWLYNTDPDGRSSDAPSHFAIDNVAGDSLELYLWPVPNTARTINVHMVTPQARFTASDLDTEVSVPTRPIELGTLWYAMEERGEELGSNGLFNEQRYLMALQDAIAKDSAESGDTMELIVS